MDLELIKWLPWIPLLGALLCGLCCMKAAWRSASGWICVGSTFLALLVALAVWPSVPEVGRTVAAFNWIHVGTFAADFSYYIDSLTMLMLAVVCGVGTLIALYAVGYMRGDRGYARFFAGVSLFIFAMTTLVMADNLVLLYLGWEGVGLCSYLLIGHYYDRPEAAAAAKKAFIVNRVGDFGFLIGIFLTYYAYGTVSIPQILAAAEQGGSAAVPWADIWIPYLLMLGAFGKSAQIPLHVWLPDAMAGPTPVSALVHAATMVTAGVYMIARLFPLFELSPFALPTVAAVGGITALFAATIALCQYDLKKIYAYSTISQLGYMFLGVGALSTAGGMFHLFTHAFFKALLFLTAGSVMHALAGQIDLRHMSGLRKKMPVTAGLMLAGCLSLAGFPFTAGFFSKDMILAEAMARGIGPQGEALYLVLAIVGLATAFLTAFYTFRLWFRVFLGPEQYEMGDEHEDDDGHTAKTQASAEPHEAPWWPMNAPLVVLAIGALFAGLLGGWISDLVSHSTAAVGHEVGAHGGEHGPTLLGFELHTAMMVISSILALAGIALAYYFHVVNRDATARIADQFAGVVRVLSNKYYVDELYDRIIVTPLRLTGFICFVIDELIVQTAVYVVAFLPRLAGYAVRPTQNGRLQGYGLGMAVGVAVVAVLVIFVAT